MTKAPLSPHHHFLVRLRIMQRGACCPQKWVCELASQPTCAEAAGWTVGPQVSGRQSRAVCPIYLRAEGTE